MSKRQLKWKELLNLCNEYQTFLNNRAILVYKSKSGEDYNKNLSSLYNSINSNDKPFTVVEIQQQPTKDSFNFIGINDFQLICELKAQEMQITLEKNREFVSYKPEKIVPVNFVSKEAKMIFENAPGSAYIITCIINDKEHFIKIGQTRTPFKHRLASYNCGTVNNWRTASTTNIKMLQSMLSTRQTFRLYLYDCNQSVKFTYHGQESSPFASPKSLAVEEIMLKEFQKQYGHKPLANIQTEPTKIKQNKTQKNKNKMSL